MAGWRKDRETPLTNSRAYVSDTGAWNQETKVRPTQHSEVKPTDHCRMLRRLYWSATCPAGRVSRSIGVIWVSPTMPRASAEWVRSKISHPTATPSICCANETTKRETT